MSYARHLITVACLAVADLAAFALAAAIIRHHQVVSAFEAHRAIAPLSLHRPTEIYVLIAMAFVFVRYLAGDYSKRQLFWDEARSTTTTLVMAGAADIFLSTLGDGPITLSPQLGTWIFLLAAVPAFRQLARFGMARAGIWKQRTALVGSGQAAYDAFLTFSESLSLGFDVRYLIVDELNNDIPESLRGLTRIGLNDPENIIARLIEMECMEVVIASEDVERARLDRLIHHLIAAHIGVAIIPSLGKLPLFGLSSNYFFGRNLLLLQVRNNLSRLPGRLMKRGIDFVGSLALLILLAPVLAAIVSLIKRANEGPAVFVQTRVGLDGREFTCLKFRTMVIDAEEQLSLWKHENPALYREYIDSNFKLKDDPRVTPIGRWLRRTSLDELPQLVNVFRGEMSLVGPRPLLPREVSEYGIGFELYRAVRPGITGLWQISGRSETKFCDRVAFDEWYIKNWSLWYDFVILLKTARTLLNRTGAY